MLYNYCFWFSLRLGSIIIAIITSISASVTLTFNVIALNNIESYKEFLVNIGLPRQLHEFFDRDIYLRLTIFQVYSCLLIISCIFLIIGAYQCKPALIYPFLFLYGVYVLLLTGIFGTLSYLLLNSTNSPGLHLLILFITVALFLLLYYLYMWMVVYSLTKVIIEIRSRLLVKRNAALMTRQTPKMEKQTATHQKNTPVLEIGTSHYEYKLYK